MTKTNDKYIMPFGKHKGEAIGDVPASYLLWFFEQVWSTKYRAVYGYIVENKKHLEKEAKNEKWTTVECEATEADIY